jgi:excinuclease ABC subunit C
MLDQKRQLLKNKIKDFPLSSGCYLMMNEQGEIIYVGKAKSLKNRVSSYFKPVHESLKTRALVEQIDDIEFILTSNEVESLVLENNLIKQHRPKYNIRLRDDKSYPYVQWNNKELYPRIEYTRKIKRHKNYSQLGPFPEGFSFGRALQKLVKLLQLRDCSTTEFLKRKTPCLLYQMHQCMAPCVRYCTPENYQKNFFLIINFIKKPHHHAELILHIKKEIETLAGVEDFEKAMVWRDALRDVEHYTEHFETQKVESLSSDENSDFIGTYSSENENDITIYKVRQGRLIAISHFYGMKMDQDLENEIAAQLLEYYLENIDLPQKIITSYSKDWNSTFLTALKKLNPKANKMEIFTNSKKFSPLLDQATLHAKEKARIRIEEKKQILPALEELQTLFSLPHLPRVIECYDIAIWQGTSPTASQVVFVDGRPSKVDYRYYHLELRDEGNNDFAMMREVMRRRLTKGKLPDLIVIDGGKGQLNIVKQVLTEFSINVPIISLAKEKQGKKERIFLPDKQEAIVLDYSKPSSKILMQIRDEAHRFSRKLHHHAEKKRLFV